MANLGKVSYSIIHRRCHKNKCLFTVNQTIVLKVNIMYNLFRIVKLCNNDLKLSHINLIEKEWTYGDD